MPLGFQRAIYQWGGSNIMAKEKEVTAEKDLVIGRDILDEANLGKHLSLIIQEGEIHIISKPLVDGQKTLEELAGCLGQESAKAYDFHLKIGGLYEGR
jgi:hypothetical protein